MERWVFILIDVYGRRVKETLLRHIMKVFIKNLQTRTEVGEDLVGNDRRNLEGKVFSFGPLSLIG